MSEVIKKYKETKKHLRKAKNILLKPDKEFDYMAKDGRMSRWGSNEESIKNIEHVEYDMNKKIEGIKETSKETSKDWMDKIHTGEF